MLWLTLRQLKSSNALKRMKAAEKLAASQNAQAFEHLVTALSDADFEVRIVSARGLGQFGERALEPLVSALKDESSSAREAAIGSLAKIGGQHIVMPLMDSLEDEDGGVRKVAANALEKIRAPESGQALEEYYRREEEARRLAEEARAKRLAEEEARLAEQKEAERRDEELIEIEGMHVTLQQMRALVIVVESSAARKLAASRSQNELTVIAVRLAYAFMGETIVDRCVKSTGHLVSLAGTAVINKESALNCVKNNFAALSDCKYFLVKEGYVADVGKAALVIALTSPPREVPA